MGNRYEDAERLLLSGTGTLWEVRVVSDLNEMDHVDLEVMAETVEEAALKAEFVARANADLYFDDPPKPQYYADRNNIHAKDELGEDVLGIAHTFGQGDES